MLFKPSDHIHQDEEHTTLVGEKLPERHADAYGRLRRVSEAMLQKRCLQVRSRTIRQMRLHEATQWGRGSEDRTAQSKGDADL